ncbi:imidazolonepropionase [Brevibacillus nitrificans]|uniref:Imidazolonepropionase n=1 Tax=Brevibacillus nitrificans TaxID=651560 RepID=A0A3M8D775_9BACL|nr:imidazolonepropionase [Brevibacillus nitrificans]RNB83683.1 imidazolonepropionase [Brevibacillus nitrificans]
MERNGKPKADLVISGAAEVLTCTGDGMDSIGKLTNGWIAVAGERIVAVGSRQEVTAAVDCGQAQVIEASGKVVVPGFVDCHTHTVFGGSRVTEYAARMTVDNPEQLKKMGIETGIHVSVGMTQAESEEELFLSAKERLVRMMHAGTTTVEIKSGYGLTLKDEIKMLNVNARLGKELPLDICSTFLGAHGWPADLPKDVYISILVEEMIPWVSGLGIATACDVWCDDGHYTAAESARILEAGQKAGLQPKIHTDCYSYVGGSDLAAEMRMLSADHLNYTPKAVMRKLADADVPGVIMPGIDFAVQHARPFDARAMLDAGMTLALATNLCPGCWTESMQFVMMLACRLYRMSPAEALRAATIGGAKALGLAHDRGSIEAGKLADLQIWNVPSYEHAIYRYGVNVIDQVVKRGKVVVDRSLVERVWV